MGAPLGIGGVIRLNVGSGDHPVPGWVNVDAWPGCQPDVVADLRALPFPDRSAARAFYGHVLEHIPFADVPAVLAEAARVLAPGGHLAVVGPDLDGFVIGSSGWWGALNGAGRWPGDAHQWGGGSGQWLRLVAAAFPNAQIVPVTSLEAEWPVSLRMDGGQVAIRARRP